MREPLTAGEALTEAEIGTLAYLFHDRREAEVLLESAGFPLARLPGGPDPWTFWHLVNQRLASGIIPDGRARVLAAARTLYPENPVLVPGSKPSGAPVGPVLEQTAGGNGPQPHKLDRWVEAKYGKALADAAKEMALARVPGLVHADLAAARDEANSRAASSPALLRHAQLLRALADAAAASQVLTTLGLDDSRLSRARLVRIYAAEVERLPEDEGSCDLLLVEAASASLRRQPGEYLDALSRFVLAVVAELPVDRPDEVLVAWIRSMGHQPIHGWEHVETCRSTQPAWLIIDLDDERSPEDDQWPRSLSAQLYKGGGEWAVRGECRGRGDLRAVIQDLLGRLPLPGSGLVVDIAAPRALFAERVEHLKVLDVGRYEPLAKECRPRLRWSRRLRHERLRERTRRWARGVDWESEAVVLPTRQEWSDEGEVVAWLEGRRSSPLVLGSGTMTGGDNDPLLALLYEGCGFILWFAAEVDDETTRAVAAARAAVVDEAESSGRPRETALRAELPERLAAMVGAPVVVWDDPDGREGFRLPPVVRLEAADG